jgi:hypothetical protein
MRHVELRVHQGLLTSTDQMIERQMNTDGTDHDEQQSRIPSAKEVQEVLNLDGLIHARNTEARAKEQTANETRSEAFHDAPPKT